MYLNDQSQFDGAIRKSGGHISERSWLRQQKVVLILPPPIFVGPRSAGTRRQGQSLRPLPRVVVAGRGVRGATRHARPQRAVLPARCRFVTTEGQSDSRAVPCGKHAWLRLSRDGTRSSAAMDVPPTGRVMLLRAVAFGSLFRLEWAGAASDGNAPDEVEQGGPFNLPSPLGDNRAVVGIS